MPVRKNPAYGGDPYMAQAAQNIAGLFAPEDPSKIAAGALAFQKAASERDEAARLADLYAMAKGPSPDIRAFDRAAIAAGRQTGTTSLYAVDQKAATDKYGYDTTANTTLATNAADNNRALRQTGITTQGSTISSLYGALNPGQVRPAVPVEVADQIGLPAMAEARGIPKPVSMDEIKAATFDTLPLPTRQNLIQTGEGTVETQTPTGPIVQSRAGAVGMPAVPDASKPVPHENYALPDGRKGTAERGPDGKLRDTQTQEELPQGVITYKGVAQGAPGEFGPKTTEAENKSAYAVTMAEPAVAQINAAFDKGELPTQSDFQLFNLLNKAPTATQPLIVQQISPQGQKFYQSLRTALPLQLMAQSGQAVTEQEYQRKLMELMPVPGENADVTAAKRQQFSTYVSAVKGLSGAAYNKAHGTVPGAPAAPVAATPPGAAAPVSTQPGAVSTPPAASAAPKIEKWERGPDGKPRKVQ
jgi:hypothetical protein